jgi:hypothetical protein
MTAGDMAFGATACVVWLGAVYKLVRTKRGAPGTAASYALVCCLAALATALTLQVTAVYRAVEQLTGRTDAGQLIAVLLVIAGTCAYQVLMVFINDPHASARRRVRPRVTAAVIAGTAATIALTLSPAARPGAQPATDDPFGAAAVVLYCGYIGYGAVDVARLALRFTRLGDRNLLRLGLYMVSAGAYVAGLYAAAKIVFVVLLTIVGPELLPIQYAVTWPMIVTGALLTSIGSTLPSWGQWAGAERPAAWFSRYISNLTLYPLWWALYQATPTIALDTRSRWADRLLPTDINYRLTRRIIEIRDGLLLLRPYHHPAATRLAERLATEHGVNPAEREATIEAAEIAMALAAKAAGLASTGATAVDLEHTEPAEQATATTGYARISDEGASLRRTTHAFCHSPVVRSAREQWSAALRSETGSLSADFPSSSAASSL